jgi:hypothetical protein
MLIDRKVVNLIVGLGENNPNLRGLIAPVGVNPSYINYPWGKRQFGKSKATPFVLIDTAINGLGSSSRMPACIALLSRFIFSLVGIMLGFWSLMATLFSGTLIGSEIPTIIVALFFISGIQLYFLGSIGKYALSIHSEIRLEPGTFDLETIGFDNLENRAKRVE